MGDHENFQDWFRELSEQIGRSVERLSEVDLDDLAGQYGVDADRARSFADAAGRWLAGNTPLFGQGQGQGQAHGSDPRDPGPTSPPPSRRPADRPASAGPHPRDLPTARQGLALSALDSGRWTVRPGSNQLAGTGEGPEPPADAPDLVGELRARDWITSDGTPTLVGHHALARWCRIAEDASSPRPHAPE
jgi:hypothetical protein